MDFYTILTSLPFGFDDSTQFIQIGISCYFQIPKIEKSSKYCHDQ